MRGISQRNYDKSDLRDASLMSILRGSGMGCRGSSRNSMQNNELQFPKLFEVALTERSSEFLEGIFGVLFLRPRRGASAVELEIADNDDALAKFSQITLSCPGNSKVREERTGDNISFIPVKYHKLNPLIAQTVLGTFTR